MEATKRVQQEEFCGLVLTYRVNDTLLCVPVEHVESVIEPPAITEMPLAPDYILGAFMHRGQTALALSLRKLLRLPPAAESNTRKESLLVIWMGEQPIGYWVDEIKGMTDSGRGHWSAVPALIRDQGITRALVCDGQVYFPLDLTQSNHLQEISRALESFEKNKLHSVTEEVAEEISEASQLESETLERQELDVTEQNPLAEADADLVEAETVAEQTAATDELVSAEEDLLPEPEQPADSADREQAIVAEDDDYTVADYPADDSLEESYEDQIEATAFAEHEIDTAALSQAIHVARFTAAEVIPLHQVPELHFDAHGQGDAYYDLIAEAAAKYGPLPTLEDTSDEMTPAHFVAEGQMDAFDESYQAMLAQEVLAAAVDIEPEEQIDDTASEVISDATLSGELSLTEEPYSFLPTTLPEDDDQEEQALSDASIDEAVVDEGTADLMAESRLAELRQAEIDAAFSDDGEIVDELVHDESVADELSLTEEPYSFIPTTLPEDDDQEEALPDASIDEAVVDEGTADVMAESRLAELRQAEIDNAFGNDGDVLDESIFDEPTLDDLSLTEEPYSFLPTTLPDDNAQEDQTLPAESIETLSGNDEEVLDESIFDEPTLDDLSLTEEPYSFIPTSLPDDVDDAAIETEELPAQQNQPLALLPYLSDDAVNESRIDSADAFSIKLDSETSERPVIALPYEDDKQAVLPDFDELVSKADYYADKMAASLKESIIETKINDHVANKIELEAETLPLEDTPEAPASADIYKFEIPQVAPEEEEPEPKPSLGSKYTTPQLDSTGIIIRPDGQVNKSFGLVKVFTIILATSAAGSWWFRDELFYREQLRKEMPSILQNEIAFLYSNRVTIVSPTQGAERMIVDTPDQEIKVIRRRHVDRALLRERRKKGVKIHRVRKGDTLWAIAERYLENPYLYPELAENSRIHNPDLIRPGDVVKITFKKNN